MSGRYVTNKGGFGEILNGSGRAATTSSKNMLHMARIISWSYILICSITVPNNFNQPDRQVLIRQRRCRGCAGTRPSSPDSILHLRRGANRDASPSTVAESGVRFPPSNTPPLAVHQASQFRRRRLDDRLHRYLVDVSLRRSLTCSILVVPLMFRVSGRPVFLPDYRGRRVTG